jgi:type I restriction enzyme M protein
MAANLAEIEARLWDAADNLRANSGLASHEYSTPVLGIIFLRFADQKFAAIEQELAGQSTGRRLPATLRRYLPATLRRYLPAHLRLSRLTPTSNWLTV